MEKRIPGAASIALKCIKRKKDKRRGEDGGGKYIARNKIAREIDCINIYTHTYTGKKNK